MRGRLSTDEGDDELKGLLSRAEHLQDQLISDEGALRAVERRSQAQRATELLFRMDAARTELMIIIDRLDKLLDD